MKKPAETSTQTADYFAEAKQISAEVSKWPDWKKAGMNFVDPKQAPPNKNQAVDTAKSERKQ